MQKQKVLGLKQFSSSLLGEKLFVGLSEGAETQHPRSEYHFQDVLQGVVENVQTWQQHIDL